MLKQGLLMLLILLGLGVTLVAQPQSGDIFWETTKIRPRTDPSWQFGWALGTDVSSDTRLEFDDAADKSGALKAELTVQNQIIECKDQYARIRLNGGQWRELPPIPSLPVNSGHNTFRVRDIEVPLSEVQDGPNGFYLGGNGFIYGVTLRLYYDESKPHPTGTITSVQSGVGLGEQVLLECSDVVSPNGRIARVVYVGYREDYNYRCDGIYRSWHYHHFREFFLGDIATHASHPRTWGVAPYAANWDTRWLPDQDQPMKIAARIEDGSGMVFITPEVTNLTLNRPGESVELCKPYDIPTCWHFLKGAKSCKVTVNGELSTMVEAQMGAGTWNGEDNNGYHINNQEVTSSLDFIGMHNYFFNTNPLEPLSAFRSGENVIGNYHGGHMHTTEMNWPGIQVKVRYAYPTAVNRPASTRAAARIVNADARAVIFDLNGRAVRGSGIAGGRAAAGGIYITSDAQGTSRFVPAF